MAEVKILIEGIHKENEKLKVSSTITLIKTNKNILVDTGSFLEEPKIIDALASEGLKPEDIDIVVLTHLHIDHTRNTNIFKNAILYVQHSPGEGKGSKWDINDMTVVAIKLDNLEIAKDVRIILTPGHVPAHLSVVVKTNQGNVVVAGDAITKKEFLNKIPYPQWDNEKFLESQKKILEIADWIIPGHGGMFKAEK
jgi:glyoxylase-like metal-dependent hydrolase (beta-lactamase superfamily II)